MNFLSLIEAKRDGKVLGPREIAAAVDACATGRVPDYQIAAFLMAVYFQGLEPGGNHRADPEHAGFGREAQFSAGPATYR